MEPRVLGRVLSAAYLLLAAAILVIAVSGVAKATPNASLADEEPASPRIGAFPPGTPEDSLGIAATPTMTAPVETTPIAPTSTDVKRVDDLRRVAGALTAYKDRTGSFPSTGGNLQSACVYEAIDKLCQLRGEVGAETLGDPRGDRLRNGYWYASDGSSFTLYAVLDGSVPSENRCTPRDATLARRSNVYCVSSIR
jgi:hypothetical protein